MDKAALPIDENMLEEFRPRINGLLKTVKWRPKDATKVRTDRKPGEKTWRESTIEATAEESASILIAAYKISGNDILLSAETHQVLTVLYRALALGMYMSKNYAKVSGLERLMQLNSTGRLSDAQRTEFSDKCQTATAVSIFVTAYYVYWALNSYRPEEVGPVNIEFSGVPEFSFRNPQEGIECLMFYYASYLDKSGMVRSSLEFVKLTLLYFQAVIDEIKIRKDSLKHAEFFTEQVYLLKGTEFSISGFDAHTNGAGVSVEFNRVKFDQIVGNRDAKHKAERLAQRLICYDFATKKNPVAELGGLPLVRLGHGEPGTGKSLIIAATATRLDELCHWLDIPFLFWPLPDTVVSTFQGGSAERMMDWMRPLRDSTRIIYAPIDDAENNFESRTRQGVSAGVREVIAVFLRNTEGAYAVNDGHAVIDVFTNLAEQIDPAVLSRTVERVYIPGAKNHQDFLDQDYLWWKRLQEIDPKFIGMKDPDDYRYLAAQARLSSLAQVYTDLREPADPQIRQIFKKVSQRFRYTEQMFFASLFKEVKDIFPMFTSRDVRNIQRAVDERLMDFDFPPDWMENPETFFRQESYDIKMKMLKDLMRQNMKGLSFADIRLQETIRYLDSLMKIVQAARERRLAELVESIKLQREAAQMVVGQEGGPKP